MTVALVLAAQPDAGLRGQLAALGVRRVDAAERAGPGLLTVAAAARAAGERVLICVGDDSVPEEILARLLGAGGTAAFTGPQSRDGSSARRRRAGRGHPRPGRARRCRRIARGAGARSRPSWARCSASSTRRGVGVRVLDAGPDGDGAVARLIADPVARDVACWAAGRQLAPAPLYGISLGLGLLAAVWFSEPTVRAQVLAIVVLLVAFAAGRSARPAGRRRTDRRRPSTGSARRPGCSPSSRSTRRWPSAPAWRPRAAAGTAGLNGIFGGSLQRLPRSRLGRRRAGRRVAAGRGRDAPAGARRLAEVCYEGLARASGSIFARPARRLLGQVITLPAGERVAVIAVTAVFFGPRLTFDVLLAWGVVAAGYVLAGAAGRRGQADPGRRRAGRLPRRRRRGAPAGRRGPGPAAAAAAAAGRVCW